MARSSISVTRPGMFLQKLVVMVFISIAVLFMESHNQGSSLPRGGAFAQLTINARTPTSVTDGSANTFIGVVGETVASALLATGTPAMLWGIVSVDDVNTVCHHISDTGSYDVTANVNHNWGDGPDDLTVQVIATGGCLASADGSGTEIVFTDQDNHKSAMVCPTNPGTDGCAIFVTGADVNTIHEGSRRRLLSTSAMVESDIYSKGSHSSSLALRNHGRELQSWTCALGVVAGAVIGYNVGLVTCFGVFSVAPWIPPTWCVTGVATASIAIGTRAGCGGCFPGDALVQLQGGYMLPIGLLAVGDKVAVWNTNKRDAGSAVSYEDVYAFGHKNPSPIATFVRITMEQPNLSSTASKTLEITPLHFLPTTEGISGKVTHKRAKDIRVGDYVWAADTNSTSTMAENIVPYLVTDVSVTLNRGLFNPFTMSGTILVDGVLASVHSEWFLDNIFDKLGMSSNLPEAYQVVLSPPRALYRIWGKQTYVAVYTWLEKHFDVVELVSNHGGAIVGTGFGAGLAVLGAAAHAIIAKPKVHSK